MTCYVKAHSGVAMNELADHLAKGMGGTTLPEARAIEPWSVCKARLIASATDIWQAQWTGLKTCTQTKNFIPKINGGLVRQLERLKPCESTRLVTHILGHDGLAAHQERIGKSRSNLCRRCGVARETFWHIATECGGTATHLPAVNELGPSKWVSRALKLLREPDLAPV